MTNYLDFSLWRLIYAKLEHKAVVMVTDTEFQPTEEEMRSVLEELYDQPNILRAVREIHPNFDVLSLPEKYTLLTAVSPEYDVAQKKMDESLVDVPYSEVELLSGKEHQ